jgi:hypothetical protein
LSIDRAGLCIRRSLCLSFIVALTLAACSPSPAPTANQALADEIQRNLAENFGAPGYATSWYPHIRSVTVQGDTLVVDTDLAARGSDASGVCSGASNYVFSNVADPSLKALEVRGSDGAVLIRRQQVSDSC